MFVINILVISPGSTALDATGESKSGAFPLPPRPVGRKVNFEVTYFIFLLFSGNTHLLLVAECFRHLLALPQLGTLGRVCMLQGGKGIQKLHIRENDL